MNSQDAFPVLFIELDFARCRSNARTDPEKGRFKTVAWNMRSYPSKGQSAPSCGPWARQNRFGLYTWQAPRTTEWQLKHRWRAVRIRRIDLRMHCIGKWETAAG
jgi:hypothetical protein